MQHCFVIYPVKLDFNDSCLNVTSMSYIIFIFSDIHYLQG